MLDGELRLLIDVDPLQLKRTVQVLLAQTCYVTHRTHRLLGVPRDEQTQDIVVPAGARGICGGGGGRHHATPSVWAMSSPRSTRCVFDRAPLMRLIRSGGSRTPGRTAPLCWRG